MSLSRSLQSLPIQETIELLKYIQNNKLKCSISFALVCCILYNNPLRKANEKSISSFVANPSMPTAHHDSTNTMYIRETMPEQDMAQDELISLPNTTIDPSHQQDFVYALEHMSDQELCNTCIHAALDTLIQIESSQLAKVALQDCQRILANQNTIITRSKVAKRLKRMGINTTIICNHSSMFKTPRNLLIPHSATPWPLQWTNQIWQDWMPQS